MLVSFKRTLWTVLFAKMLINTLFVLPPKVDHIVLISVINGSLVVAHTSHLKAV